MSRAGAAPDRSYPGAVEILLWLAPTGVVAVVMMAWAAWAGRPRRVERDRSEESLARFAAAIGRDHLGVARPRPMASRDRSTGIAVRPSRGGVPARPAPGTGSRDRRSA